MTTDSFETIMKGRIARRVEDLDEATANAIAEAEVPSEYAGLDEKFGSS